MRFSPRAGDATISKKSHHHRKQEIARVAAALMEDENWGTRRKTLGARMLPSRRVSSQILPAYVCIPPPPPHNRHRKTDLNYGENPDGRPALPPKEKQSHKDAIFSANGY